MVSESMTYRDWTALVNTRPDDGAGKGFRAILKNLLLRSGYLSRKPEYKTGLKSPLDMFLPLCYVNFDIYQK